MKELTNRQKEVLQIVTDYIDKYKQSPTHHQIACNMGIKAVSSVSRHIRVLVDLGYIRRLSGERGVALVKQRKYKQRILKGFSVASITGSQWNINLVCDTCGFQQSIKSHMKPYTDGWELKNTLTCRKCKQNEKDGKDEKLQMTTKEFAKNQVIVARCFDQDADENIKKGFEMVDKMFEKEKEVAKEGVLLEVMKNILKDYINKDDWYSYKVVGDYESFEVELYSKDHLRIDRVKLEKKLHASIPNLSIVYK